MKPILETAEYQRLHGPYPGRLVRPWRKWGPYTADRAWGTVREDYSANGTAWDYLPHDLARSKAYRWGEDGIAGLSDRYQILVFALALWNGRDPILKERLFGLNNSEGNHGEDVKEYYYYLDNTPSHSYQKMLYKYPQREFPYGWLVEENRTRGGHGPEFELIDTGIFDDDRYFDVFIEYAKASEEDICIRIEAFNRGPEDAELHLLPHLWFRNSWAWGDPAGPEPSMVLGNNSGGHIDIQADDRSARPPQNLRDIYQLGPAPSVRRGPRNAAVHRQRNQCAASLWTGKREPQAIRQGRFPPLHRQRRARSGESRAARHQGLHRLQAADPGRRIRGITSAPHSGDRLADPLGAVDDIIAERKREADLFLQRRSSRPRHRRRAHDPAAGLRGLAVEQANVLLRCEPVARRRQPEVPAAGFPLARPQSAVGGTSTPCGFFPCPTSGSIRGSPLGTSRFSAPPWRSSIPGFAADNLWFLLFEQFQHTNGQIPAYEWEFSDLNPPVHAWAVWRVYEIERDRTGNSNREFLEKCFHKLLINFAWWVNKVDSQGNNVFEGGFLGLDNITVVDRSEKLPNGAILEQSDGTGWMAFFCIYMMHIALELAKENRTYESLATKFFQHYTFIGKGHEERRRARFSAVGRSRWLLLRRAPLSQRGVPPFPRALAGGTDPDVRRGRAPRGGAEAAPRVHRGPAVVFAQPPDAGQARLHPGRARWQGNADSIHRRPRAAEAAAGAHLG